MKRRCIRAASECKSLDEFPGAIERCAACPALQLDAMPGEQPAKPLQVARARFGRHSNATAAAKLLAGRSGLEPPAGVCGIYAMCVSVSGYGSGFRARLGATGATNGDSPKTRVL